MFRYDSQFIGYLCNRTYALLYLLRLKVNKEEVMRFVCKVYIMDVVTKETLNGIAVYAKILNEINLKFHVLIEDNTEKQFHENE